MHNSDHEQDSIDRIREGWQALRPDMDTSAIGTIGRVIRIARHVTLLSDHVLAEFGISRGEFDVLSAVRRAATPLTPSELARGLVTSNASITKRMVALETLGLAVRERGAGDRRVVRVRLTEEGIAVIDRAVPAQLAFERELDGQLSPDERESFEGTLRTVLADLERRAE
ncbi:MAG: MarR family transcriptional regulator [Glaciihabitans sp.]